MHITYPSSHFRGWVVSSFRGRGMDWLGGGYALHMPYSQQSLKRDKPMEENTNGLFLGCRLVLQVVVEVERYAAAQIEWLVYCICER